MAPPEKRRKLSSTLQLRFRAKKNGKAKVPTPITTKNLASAITRLGTGKRAFYTKNASGTLDAPAANSPSKFVFCLTDPSAWSLVFASSSDAGNQPQVKHNYMKLQCTFRCQEANLAPCALFAFVVSLNDAAINSLNGQALASANLVNTTNYLFGVDGNIILNPDYFKVHRAYHKILGVKPYSGGPDVTDLSDFFLHFNFSQKMHSMLKNPTTGWTNISEAELDGSARRYLIAFQVSCTNIATPGFRLAINSLQTVIW